MSRAAVLLLLTLLSTAAGAQPTRQAYKHVDSEGRVSYSQTPPVSDAKKVDLPPPRKADQAQRDYEREALRRQEQLERRQQFEREREAEREAMVEARKKRETNYAPNAIAIAARTVTTRARYSMEAERGPSQYRPRPK